MASLAEALAYADQVQKTSNPLASNMEAGLQGLFGGMEKRREIDKQNLDMALKVMEIGTKAQEIKIKQRTADLNENMMKAFGMIPAGDKEHASAVQGAWDMLGSGKADQNSMPTTEGGRLAKMANTMEFRPGWSAKGGFSFRAYPKKGASAAEVHNNLLEQKMDMAAAEKMARNEAYQKMTAGMKPWQIAQVKPTQAVVTPDSIAKYLPIAKAIRTGDTKGYQKLMAGVSAPGDKSDTALLMGSIDQIRQNLLKETSMREAAAKAASSASALKWPSMGGGIGDETDMTDTTDGEE